MTAALYATFVGFAGLLAVMPGPDSILVLRYGMGSRGAGVAAAVGSAAGNLTWSILAALGVGALIAHSSEAQLWVKIVGGVYVIFLGIRGMIPSVTPAGAAPRRPAWLERAGAGGSGYLTCMTNPKVALFYVAVLPQFVAASSSAQLETLVLGLTVTGIQLGYLSLVAFIAHRVGRVITNPRVLRGAEIVSSAILLVLGFVVLSSLAW